MAPNKQLLVVGSGIFGTSTALSFLKEGSWDVRIIDKAVEQPAVDAASTDINKILRAGDYADYEMSRLSLEAIHEWEKPEWEGTYHPTGVVILGPADKDISWIKESFDNLEKLKITPTPFLNGAAVRAHFEAQGLGETVGDFVNKTGYFNPIGGWGEAERAVRVGHKMVEKLGGTIEGGKEVAELVVEETGGAKEVKGVKLVDGEVIKADFVIVATGAWTPSLFFTPELALSSILTASGQSVGKWVLNEAERKVHDKMPVIWDFEDGCYVFPPTKGKREDGGAVVKAAIHHLGYVNPEVEKNGCSVPRTVLTPGAESGAIPKEMVHNIRKGAGKFFPKLAQKDFSSTRMCWYSETANGDWLIDHHPTLKNVMFATGGSGHAFKFFPTIGSLVLDRFKNTLLPELATRFSFQNRGGDVGADLRAGLGDGRKLLKVGELCVRGDLKCGLAEKLEIEKLESAGSRARL